MREQVWGPPGLGMQGGGQQVPTARGVVLKPVQRSMAQREGAGLSVKDQVTQTQCSRVPRIVCTCEEVGVGVVPRTPEKVPGGGKTDPEDSCSEARQPPAGQHCRSPCSWRGWGLRRGGEMGGWEGDWGVKPAGIAKGKAADQQVLSGQYSSQGTSRESPHHGRSRAVVQIIWLSLMKLSHAAY